MTESLFVFSHSNEEPWILWQKKESVMELQEQTQTDGRYVNGEMGAAVQTVLTSERHLQPQIKRQQYFSVLNRMNNASRRTGTFSSWASGTT